MAFSGAYRAHVRTFIRSFLVVAILVCRSYTVENVIVVLMRNAYISGLVKPGLCAVFE